MSPVRPDSVDLSEYPGLEAVLRKAMERASDGLPPDVTIGAASGSLASAGISRAQARSGYADAVSAAVKKYLLGEGT